MIQCTLAKSSVQDAIPRAHRRVCCASRSLAVEWLENYTRPTAPDGLAILTNNEYAASACLCSASPICRYKSQSCCLQIAEGQRKVGRESSAGTQRPLHQIVAAAVELKYLHLLPELLDRLIAEAPYFFEADRLTTLREDDIATLAFVASHLPVRPHLSPRSISAPYYKSLPLSLRMPLYCYELFQPLDALFCCYGGKPCGPKQSSAETEARLYVALGLTQDLQEVKPILSVLSEQLGKTFIDDGECAILIYVGSLLLRCLSALTQLMIPVQPQTTGGAKPWACQQKSAGKAHKPCLADCFIHADYIFVGTRQCHALSADWQAGTEAKLNSAGCQIAPEYGPDF